MFDFRTIEIAAIVFLSACCVTVPESEEQLFTPDPAIERLTVMPIAPSSIELVPPTPLELNVPLIRFNGHVNLELAQGFITVLNLAAQAGAKAVVFEINSGGGEVDAGFRMIKAIEQVPFPVHCIVDGEGSSMAFYLLQGCTSRSMTRRSRLMLHEASWSTTFDAKADPINFFNKMEEIQRVTRGLLEHTSTRTKIPMKTLLTKTKDRRCWWLNHEEARANNMVDHVYVSTAEVLESLRKSLRLPTTPHP